jgi:hypothetical protein
MQSASKREVCYQARDEYHKCLDKKGNEPEECAGESKAFHEKCPGSWIKYFNQQRERQLVLELQADVTRLKREYENTATAAQDTSV